MYRTARDAFPHIESLTRRAGRVVLETQTSIELTPMSPYENRLNNEAFRRIALIASIRTGSEKALESTIANKPDSLEVELQSAGILHLQTYQKALEDKNVLFIYFECDELDQEKAISILKASSPWCQRLEAHLLPHPRATEQNAPWQRAEFINVIADNIDRNRNIGKPQGLVAALKPGSELWYRTLHQTNWPGVIDQMHRSNNQNWTTFLLEFGDELLLFTHVEYLGDNPQADQAAMEGDPVSQRWWTHTQPCLYSPTKEKGPWLEMNAL